jgi:integrase
VIPYGEAVTLIGEMKKRRGTSLWVFPSQNRSQGHRGPRKTREAAEGRWYQICGCTIFAALSIEACRNPSKRAVIAAAMGHKSLQSARSYLHLQVDAVRDAMERAAVKSGELANA